MNNILNAGCCVCVLLWITTGCSTPGQDGLIEFRTKHPNQAKAYKCSPVGTKMLDAIFRVKSTTISGIGNSMKERFGEYPGLAEYADRIVNQEKVANRMWNENMDRLREAAKDGGVICEFEWSDGITREMGLLVLKSGEIIVRQPWLSEIITEAP